MLGLTMMGCNDSFLDRFPEDSLTEKSFFKSVSDLETYAYGLYNWGASTTDGVSDNVIYCEEEFYKLKYCSTVVYMVPRA